MTGSEFNKALRSISKGIYKILESQDLLGELTDKNRKNPEFFAPNLNRLQSKELAWLNTNYESKYDIIMDAFTNIMISKNPFTNFVKKGNKGHKSGIEEWLHLIFQREISRLSQMQYKKRMNEINEDKVHTLDDETSSEAFDRLLSKYDTQLERQFSTEEELAFEQLIKKIKKELDMEANSEVYHLILDMLFVGMGKSEIARLLGVSPAKISQRIKKIRNAINEVARFYSRKGDDTLEKMVKKYTSASVVGNRNVETNVNVLLHQLVSVGIIFNHRNAG